MEGLNIRAGSLIIKEHTRHLRVRKVHQFLLHPLFNASTLENDIGIIKIVGDLLPWNDYVKPIHLATVQSASGVCNVCGWGVMDPTKGLDFKLRAVHVSIINNDMCKEIYIGHSILGGMMCAGDPEKDACRGDSGGPLVCENKTILMGVVSSGAKECGQSPGVYSSVPYYFSWIQENIKISSRSNEDSKPDEYPDEDSSTTTSSYNSLKDFHSTGLLAHCLLISNFMVNLWD